MYFTDTVYGNFNHSRFAPALLLATLSPLSLTRPDGGVQELGTDTGAFSMMLNGRAQLG